MMLNLLTEIFKYRTREMQIDTTLILKCKLVVKAFLFMNYVEDNIKLENMKKLI